MGRQADMEPLVNAEDVRLTPAQQKWVIAAVELRIEELIQAEEATITDKQQVENVELTMLCQLQTKLTGRDAWGRKLMDPTGEDGHGWWSCNNYDCQVHPNEQYKGWNA